MDIRKYYIAIDIGPSAGRHIALWEEDGTIKTKEIYRFDNQPIVENNHFFWDMELIFSNIIEGLTLAGNQKIKPVSIGIDTWPADYALVNARGDILGEPMALWDERTRGALKEVERVFSQEALYSTTGYQHQRYNTIFQLVADKLQRPNVFYAAGKMMLIADYIMFRLTGEPISEYTSATTTGLVDAPKRTWAKSIIEKLDIPFKLFGTLTQPGGILGTLLPELAQEIGYDTKVAVVATHNTASCVMGTPLKDNSLYLSSGTLSFMGIEADEPNLSNTSFGYNLSNEGGYGNTHLLQKNMMGLWMLQALRRREGIGKTFVDFMLLAEKEIDFASIIDVQDRVFFTTDNMGKAIDDYCRQTGQPVAENLGQQLACVYHSMAANYKKALAEIEETQGKTYDSICVVGGGSQDRLLNQLTANACGKKVYAGPTEAAAVGNGVSQMLTDGVFSSLKQAREAIARSFIIECFEPKK